MAVINGLQRGLTKDDLVELTQGPPVQEQVVKGEKKTVHNVLSGLTANVVEATVREVCRDWDDDFEKNRSQLRARQLARLGYSIRRAMDANRWSACFSGERVYAEVAGTLAPTRVNVNANSTFRLGVAAAVSGMSDEEIEKLANEEALQGAAPAAPPAGKRVVTGRA